jgi:hypothetical protein
MNRLTLLFGLFVYSATSLAQGCSDSGFCTLGALKPDRIFMPKIKLRVHSLELTQHYGRTEQGDHIYSSFVDVVIGIHRKTMIQVRMPSYNIISGPMPTSQGWGDYHFNLSHVVWEHPKYHVSLSVGSKIYNRSQEVIRSAEGHPMPLYQQPSLGTDDVVVGLSFINRMWMVAAAYRKPIRFSASQFDHDVWNESPLQSVVQQYDPSRGLISGDDIMIRMERSFRFSQWTLYAGILNLYRVQPDRILTADDSYTYVKGSSGLASNFVSGLRYRLNVHHSLRLLTSVRLLQREANPDGLARTFVSQVGYEYRF